jgi:hypothetical protein
MKTTLTVLAVCASSFFFAQAKIEALETEYNYDTLYQGDPVNHDFKFVNTGNAPLIILSAKTSCGCDVSNWSREPISPGDTTIVNYKYDSNRIGSINKSMTIQSNAENSPTILVRNKGYIMPKE